MANVSVVQNRATTGAGAALVIRDEKRWTIFNSFIAPRQVNYSGYQSSYNEVPRPDRQPILQRSGFGLRKITMEVFIGSADMFDNGVNQQLINLENLAKSIQPIYIEYDPRTEGAWRITSLSYDSVLRDPVSNEITRATANIEFTEIANPNSNTLNAIGSSATRRPKKITSPRGGISLTQVAKQYYGTDSKLIVAAIAKASGIKNPKHVPAGKRITLP